MRPLRSRLVTFTFAILLSLAPLYGLTLERPAFLAQERRVPASPPQPTLRSVFGKELAKGLEGYLTDGFPFRPELRRLHAAITFSAYLQSDKGGIYAADGGIGSFAALDEGSAAEVAAMVARVSGLLEGVNAYYSVIPDKSEYAGRYLPGFEAGAAHAAMASAPGMGGLTYVDVTGSLTYRSYYLTDLHWDQTALMPVAERLGEAMGFAFDPGPYELREAGLFKGVYAGLSALPCGPEPMGYLHWDVMEAYYLDVGSMAFVRGEVYDRGKLGGHDPYDLFLCGIQPLVALKGGGPDGRELYLFRDSFGSSLAPLLAGAYSWIYLIDFRCLDLRTLSEAVSFKPGSDALFIYSSQVINNPGSLLVR
ncbi:MAG: hypothetical protein FWE70_03500 [Oscillospiraceae bacterium]|nr:hypothetical protein [Oscillospiraceae bacterium]